MANAMSRGVNVMAIFVAPLTRITRTERGLPSWPALRGLSQDDWAISIRTYDVDALACSKCGGRLRILACVTDPNEARDFLKRIGLPSDAPSAARARDATEEVELDEYSAADGRRESRPRR